jgi:hypothetical protein
VEVEVELDLVLSVLAVVLVLPVLVVLVDREPILWDEMATTGQCKVRLISPPARLPAVLAPILTATPPSAVFQEEVSGRSAATDTSS